MPPAAARERPCMVVLGSGGHTGEMLALLQQIRLPEQALLLLHADTDHTSQQRMLAAQPPIPGIGAATWLSVTRSREVGQSWLSTVHSTAKSFTQCIALLAAHKPALVLCNGPGTCVPPAAAAFLLRFLGISDCSIVFLESICRVKALSLTGKLLSPIADKLLVQWPTVHTP